MSIKILHMAPLGAGGISKLTVTINGLIDLKKLKFDYLVFKDEKTFYEDIVYKYGAEKRLIDVSKYNNKLFLYFKKYQLTKQMLKENYYDVVHVDASTPMDVIIGMAARAAGVRTVVIHSHIAGDNKRSIFRKIYLEICRKKMTSVFDDFFAISDSAAKFMFPSTVVTQKKYKLIANGIKTEQYKFNIEERKVIRKTLNIEDKFVLGHVGRFSEEKNHEFIIQVFEQITKSHLNSVLLLVGDGKLKSSIENMVIRKNLQNKVIFLGTSHDVPKLMLAMDAFIFPSFHEGLGIAAVESQCSGLQTFCSRGIPEVTNITPTFHYIEGYNAKEWATEILSNITKTRQDYIMEVKNAGFDIVKVAKEMEIYYLEKSL